MNKVILINKPSGMTSHDVVNRLRKIFGIKRIGHTGTLDPLARGLLVVCLGEATKLVPFLEQDDKVYDVEIMLGKATSTGDLAGEVVAEALVPNFSPEIIDQVLGQFTGEIVQTPPKYSAIKVEGKKLYEYARKNQAVEIPQRTVKIFRLERTSELDYRDGLCTFRFVAHVSKGTYIRTLCEDIAKALELPGVMSDLVRIRCGKFHLSDASTLEEAEQNKLRFIPMLEALNLPVITVTEDMLKRVKNGMVLPAERFKEKLSQFAIADEGKLLAIYQFEENKNVYKAVRIWL
ncbi:MAG TPA: tRNA pseudouridine(55) synthase TruB [Bacilli bacterium]|jgi:tRNA pseudouridine55 synthase|nr:MAG: tRNA pseudouridine synthase B [Tenericutes bacterium ADurb.Bin140]HOE78050.1 tRNA pseudouridine(55) synthase TruB [Bacilli bacterium]HON63414.1 tRNA pseudouridine(55) synthase TruB [Bacilli bacterium]HOR95960.1 tRNA pseudouridine(55) synthase TruB [Bacilli bacterium]HPD13122.1 tRNA pseudouridine(55) synthase TruB [Bacilli bacterium]